jgi:dephospho-CoA kinase
MRIVGLTGNFGSGKSTVASLFREAGIPALDADRLSREVASPGGAAYPAIVREFGEAVVGPDGRIDRKKLGEIVFADPGQRAKLEAITHPAILDAMKAAVAALASAGHRVVVVEASLIHESGRRGLFTEVITVRCDAGTQLRRVMARDGISPEQAAARIDAQMDAENKASRSDYVIDNSGDTEETRRQVASIVRRILED